MAVQVEQPAGVPARGHGRGLPAFLLLLLLPIQAALGQSLVFTNAAQSPVTTYFFGTDRIFVRLTDAASNTSPATIQTTSLTALDVPGLDTETAGLVLTETGANSGIFFGPAGGFTLTFAVPSIGNGVLEGKDGDALQAIFAPRALNSVITLRKSPTAATVRLLDAAFADETLYFLDVDTAVLEVADDDENRNPGVADTLQALTTVSPGGDTETFTLTETGANTGVFRRSLVPAAGTANSGNGVIEGSSGAQLTLAFTDPEGGGTAVDAANLLQVTNSTTQITDSAGTAIASQGLPSSQLFVTVFDGDQNTDFATQQQVTVQVTSTDTADAITVTLFETTNNSGVFRNPVGIPVAQATNGVTTNGILETDHNATITATYVDAARPADTSNDTVPGQVTPVASVVQQTNASQTPQTFFQAPADRIFLRVVDSDQNLDADTAESVSVTLTTSGLVGGDTQTVTLTETGANTGIFFFAAGVPLVRSPTPVGNNGTLEVLEGDSVRARYTDPNDGADVSTFDSGINIITSATVSFIATASPPPGGQYAVGDAIVVEVLDVDQNQSHLTTESVAAVVSFPGTGDQETITLFETGANTSRFRNAVGSLTSAISTVVAANGVLALSVPASIRVTYTDPNDGTDVATTTGTVLAKEVNGTLVFTSSTGTPVTSFFIGIDNLFVTVTDPDENTNAATTESITLTLLDLVTADTEQLTLQETGVNTGVFRNTAGLVSSIVATSPNNGLLETGDGAQVTANYLDNESGFLLFNLTTMRLQPTVSISAFTTTTGAVVSVLRVDVNPLNSDRIFVTVTDPDENSRSATAQTLTSAVLITNLTNGDSEVITLVETGLSTGVFRNTVGLPLSLASQVPTTAGDNVISASDGDVLQARYTDKDPSPLDISVANAVVQFRASSSIQLTNVGGAQQNTFRLNSLTEPIFISVNDPDQNQDPLNPENVTVTLRHVPPTAGEGIFSILLTETTSSSGIFRNTTSPLFAEVAATTLGPPLQSFDGAQIRAEYVDPNDPTDAPVSNIATLRTTPTTALVVIAGAPGSTTQQLTFDIGVQQVFVTVIDEDQDLNAQAIDTIVVQLIDLTTGDLVNLPLTEINPDSNGVFTNLTGLDLEVNPNLPDTRLQTAHNSTFTANYSDPTPGDGSLDFDSAIALIPAVAPIVDLTDGAGLSTDPFLIGVDRVFLTLFDRDENTTGSQRELLVASGVITSLVLGDTETVSLRETSFSTDEFRSEPGLPVALAVAAIPGNGILEIGSVGELIQGCFTDNRDPGGGDFDCLTAGTDLPPSTSLTRFTNATGTVQTVFTIGASDIFVTVTDADQNIDPSIAENLFVSVSASITGDVETVTVTETGVNTGVFRNAAGFPSTIDVAVADGVLQVAGASVLTAVYTDPADPSDVSSHTATLLVPQVSGGQFLITTDLTGFSGVLNFTTSAVIGVDSLFVVLEDIDSNTNPVTTETVSVLLTGTGGTGGNDQVLVTLVEEGPNSRFFVNDGSTYLAAPPSTSLAVTSVVDPVVMTDQILQTFDREIVQATWVDPQSIADTRTATVEMRIFEVAASIFFSDAAGTPKSIFPIAPPAAADRLFVTLVDPDENVNAATQQSVIVTLFDPITNDVVTVTLQETGNDTNTFRNVTGVPSTLAVSLPDAILQTVDRSVIDVTYEDKDSASDSQLATAEMRVAQGGGAVRLVDQFGNDRLVYRMINLPSELVFIRVNDPDENGNPAAADSIEAVLESVSVGDTLVVTLTETGLSTGIFVNTTGVLVLPACFPVADGILQAKHATDIRATYTDVDDPLDTSFDLATALNSRTFATIDFVDDPVTRSPVTTFLIGGTPGLLVAVTDTDEDEDPCFVETITVSITALASGDLESVTLTETASNSGVFVSALPGLPSEIDPPVGVDGTLQVKHPTNAEARYVDNDDLVDQAVATAASVMFETSASCQFLSDIAGTPLASGTYAIGIDRIFVEVFDPDQDRDFATQESVTAFLQSTGSLDVVTMTLVETNAHSGLFRNILPTPPNTIDGIPSQVALPVSSDSTLQTSDDEQVFFLYVDPSDPTDICTDVATLELRPTTSTTQFTNSTGGPRSFYSIQFDQVFVTVVDADENADPSVIETITVQVSSLFAAPASPDVEIVDLFETGTGTGVFRNTTGLPMQVGPSNSGDGILQTGDGTTIEARYTDFDDPTDVSVSTARTFVASTNSSVQFTDQFIGSAVFQYTIGAGDVFVEVTDFDENTNGNSPQSVIATVRVTATGDVESFVLTEADDPGTGVVTSDDSSIFRNLFGIQSTLASAATSFNGVLEVVDGAFLTVSYTDDDFPLDTAVNTQSVVMRTAQTASSIVLFNQNLVPVTEFLVVQDRVIVELTDPDQNGNPSLAETVIVTIDLGAQGFDRETFTATEVGLNAGVFRTIAIPTARLGAGLFGNPNNGILEAVGDLPGGLGTDTFTVSYQDPNDGLDAAVEIGTITTETFSTLDFTNSLGTPVTTYVIGVDRIFLRVFDRDQNLSSSVKDTVKVTVEDFGTGDREIVTLQETGLDTAIFTNPGGLPTIFDLSAVPGDGLLQTGDPSDDTVQAEYLDPTDPTDNFFDQADLVPRDPNDRDGDGIPNALETATPGMDPNDPTDATLDFDDDGRDNRTELVVDGTDPNDDTDNAPVPVISPNGVLLDPGVIRLDGSASFDATTRPPRIGILRYLWSQVGTSPTVVSISDPTAIQPFFVARTPGIYTVRLTVTDADFAVRSATADIEIADLPPTANPGPGGSMRFSGASLPFPAYQLDGSKSSDANAQTLSFSWGAGPGNTVGTITFDNASAASPRITAVQRPGRAVVRLTVTDTSAQTDTKDVVVLVHDDLSPFPFRNHAPTSEAGLDVTTTAGIGVTATLDGRASRDQDGEAIQFTWQFEAFPDGGPPGPITGGVSNAVNAQATATGLSQVGVYTYTLQVRDTHTGGLGLAFGDIDRVRVTAQTLANHVPSANAGGPYQFSTLARAQLSGAGSGDADPGDTLSFFWTQVAGVRTALEDPNVRDPFVTFFVPGVYRYRLVVTDAVGNQSIPSDCVVRVGRTGDNPPVANAGVDQIGAVGQATVLDGRNSIDPDGSVLRFFWRQIGGTRLLLSDPNAATPQFTPTFAGTYEFELVVDDGTHFSPPDRVLVAVDPPVANAGPDQSRVLPNDGSPLIVTLNGSGSFDPSPGPQALTFQWAQVSGPSVTLSNATASLPTFSTLVQGTYTFVLVVFDGATFSPQVDLNRPDDAFVKIIVSNSVNTIPTALAGIDQFVAQGSVVTLDGSASFDADGDPITFQWVQTAGPPVLLTPNGTVQRPTFIPPVGGSAYTFRLTVSDPTNRTSSDTVTVFATGGATGGGGGNTGGAGVGNGTSSSGATFTFAGGGGGGGCSAVPLYVTGKMEDHLPQAILNLLLLVLPFLAALSWRRELEERHARRRV